MGIVARIVEFANNEGISVFEIERKIGASKGVIYRASKNDSDIQAKWVSLIVDNYPLLSPLWLLTGRGDMYIDLPKPKGGRSASISVSNIGSIKGGMSLANGLDKGANDDTLNAETLRLQLEAKDRQLAQKDEQINSLLLILSQQSSQ